MTRSFSSMLLGLQYLAATLTENADLKQALKHLPRDVFSSSLISALLANRLEQQTPFEFHFQLGARRVNFP